MQTGFRVNLSPVKEPLGFIKLVEWFAALFAFGCCGGYTGMNVISLICGDGKNETLNATFSYPFRLNQVLLVEDNVTLCNRRASETRLMGDVFVRGGVFRGRGRPGIPLLHAFAFLWLVCASAWAQGLQKVKYATGTDGVSASLPLCRKQNVTCEVTELSSMRTLDISVVFGFLNLIIWSANAWFVYKETCWHSHTRNSQQDAERGRGPGPI
ncbi:hypothetical protein AMELA_G00178070 [Ameiurus melas]|uniref:MARVEL domain-containing protein n=1 Tax=Ameiurus melas TaxID=219545 RepID=A0A7J6A9L0_AMEME|nr:hypothetical protein AMELA_G00178070 [Ameiurus melas]